MGELFQKNFCLAVFKKEKIVVYIRRKQKDRFALWKTKN